MHKNAEIVRQGYEAFNKADMNALSEIFDQKASWHTPGKSTASGDFVGRDAVFGQFGRYGGETGGTFKAELRHLTTDDEGRVVAIHHNTGERNGKHLEADCCLVIQIENGRIVDGKEHLYDLAAWDEFWS